MTLAQWIDPSDDDVTTVVSNQITDIADKSEQGNDMLGIFPAALLANFDGADAEALDYTSEDQQRQVATFAADAELDTAQSKFGGSSLLVDGTGDYVSFPNREVVSYGLYHLDTNDFTVECWVRFNGDPGTGLMPFVAQWNPTGNERAWMMGLDNNELKFWYTANGTTQFATSETWDPADATWYHVAVTREADEVRLFIDGTQLGSDVTISTAIFRSAADLVVGANPNGSQYHNGWIEDVRVINGVAAYTGNFTAPVAALGELPGGPDEVTVDSKRAMVMVPGSSMVIAEADQTNLNSLNETIVIAFSDDGLDGGDNMSSLMSQTDGDWDDVAAGWRIDKRQGFTPTRAQSGEGNSPAREVNDGVFSGVVALTLSDDLQLLRTTTNGALTNDAASATAQTPFLANMDGADTDTSYTSEDKYARVATFSGDAQIDTAQSQFGGASMLFDGTGDWIDFPTDRKLHLQGSDFTVECWVRFNGAPGSARMGIIGMWDETADERGYLLVVDNDVLEWRGSSAGTDDAVRMSFTWTPADATWYHIAIVHDEDGERMYVDGVLEDDNTGAGLIYYVTPAKLTVGAEGSTGARSELNGWIDDCRITIGAALYKKEFAVPTAANIDTVFPRPADFNIGWQPGEEPGVGGVESWVNGNIHEVIRYDGFLRTDERQRLEGYLNHKWGGALVEGHPYRDNAPDIVIDCELVANFDGSDGATSYTSESGQVATFVANAELDAAEVKYGSTSLLLDGTADVLTFPDSTDWEFGSGAFSVECWVRFNGDPGTGDLNFVGQFQPTGDERGWSLNLSNNLLRFEWTTDGTTGTEASETTAWNPETDIWYHLAVTRDADDDLRMFVDGVLLKTVANAVTIYAAASALAIGANVDGSNEHNGWIDAVRIVKGDAIYLRDFDVPHRGFVLPVPASLIANFNAPFGQDDSTDYTSEDALAQTATFVSDAILDTAQAKFGRTSLRCDITLDGVTFPDNDVYHFGADDFTVEMWVRFESIAGNQMFIGQWTTGSQLSWVWLIVSNLLRFDRSTGGGDQATMITDSWTPSLNQWYHIAVVRRGTDMEQWIDGISGGVDGTIASSVLHDSTGLLEIGWYVAGSFGTDGWIDGVRVTKGVALYDEGDFTVPLDAPGEPVV